MAIESWGNTFDDCGDCRVAQKQIEALTKERDELQAKVEYLKHMLELEGYDADGILRMMEIDNAKK